MVANWTLDTASRICGAWLTLAEVVGDSGPPAHCNMSPRADPRERDRSAWAALLHACTETPGPP